MIILLKSVKIIDPSSPHHQAKADVVIKNGVIQKIAKAGTLDDKADKTFEGKNNHLSIGWFDLRSNFREPGFEYKEDMNSGTAAAIRGGFTGVMLMPSTEPPVNGKADVEFIKSKTASGLVQIVPSGTLSHNREGRDLSEMYDMWNSGARAFTDDKIPVSDSGLMLRALMYAKNFGGLIMSFADDKDLSAKGQVNEGVMNVQLGIKGMPALAEEVMITRDLSLAEYAEAPIHFSTISTAGSVDLIRQAKKKGLKVSADVAVHQLILDETALAGFDTNFKVKPPLRTKGDVKALHQGVKDGTIDCVCSDHSPEDIENKRKEFDLASYGIIGLQTAFGLMNKALHKDMKLEDIIGLITIQPRRILGLEIPSIREGNAADLTLFDPAAEWTFSESDIVSKSKNTPFHGEKLLGRPVAVFNRNRSAECA
jgi:dihydroorotase